MAKKQAQATALPAFDAAAAVRGKTMEIVIQDLRDRYYLALEADRATLTETVIIPTLSALIQRKVAHRERIAAKSAA